MHKPRDSGNPQDRRRGGTAGGIAGGPSEALQAHGVQPGPDVRGPRRSARPGCCRSQPAQRARIFHRSLTRGLLSSFTASSCPVGSPDASNIRWGHELRRRGTDHCLSGRDDALCRPKPSFLMMCGIPGGRSLKLLILGGAARTAVARAPKMDISPISSVRGSGKQAAPSEPAGRTFRSSRAHSISPSDGCWAVASDRPVPDLDGVLKCERETWGLCPRVNPGPRGATRTARTRTGDAA